MAAIGFPADYRRAMKQTQLEGGEISPRTSAMRNVALSKTRGLTADSSQAQNGGQTNQHSLTSNPHE